MSMLQDLSGQSLGHYRLIQSIERGGMAAVFLAQDVHLQRDVAIKIFQNRTDRARNDEFFRRFTREAQTVARLDHPNILLVYDYGEQDGIAYLVMPYLALGSLKQRLKARSVLPVSEALLLIAQLLEALQYAHNQGLIHRDIKPGNVLFKNEQTPLLADFGLVKKMVTSDPEITIMNSLGGDLHALQLTNSQIMGTPYYMAPEQIRGQVQPASDIYSMGVVLYEMLTGQHPLIRDYTAETTQILLKQLNEAPHPIRALNPAIPPELAHAIMRSLEKDPLLRYQSPMDFLQALRSSEVAWSTDPLSALIRQGVYKQSALNNGPETVVPEEKTPEMPVLDENRTIAISEEQDVEGPAVLHPHFKITRRWVVGTLIAGASIAGFASLSPLAFRHSSGLGISPTPPHAISAKSTPVPTPPHATSAKSTPAPTTKQARLIYRGHTFDIKAVTWSSFSDGALIASTDGNSVQVWRAQDGVRLYSSDAQSGDLANGNLFLEGTGNGKCGLTWSPIDPGELAFFVTTGQMNNQSTTYLWKQNFTSAEAGSLNGMGPVVHLPMSQPMSLALSPDGYFLAVGGTQEVTILPDGKGAAVWNLQQKNEYVWELSWSPDGKYLAFSTSSTTQIWDVSALDHNATNTEFNGVLLSKLDGGAGDIAWSPDSKLLAVGTQFGPIELWDLAQRKISRTLGKAGSAVRAIAWSPDGKYITWTNEGIRTVGVWNTITGEQVFLYEGHAQGLPDEGWRIGVGSVTWSPNGQFIASGDNGGAVHIWAAPR